jgi:hypothetical protein
MSNRVSPVIVMYRHVQPAGPEVPPISDATPDNLSGFSTGCERDGGDGVGAEVTGVGTVTADGVVGLEVGSHAAITNPS